MVWLQSAGPMIATEDKDFKRSRKLSAFHTCKTRAKGPVVVRRRNRWVLGICQRTETESLRTQKCLNAPCVFRSSWLVKCWLYAHCLAVSHCIRQPRQNGSFLDTCSTGTSWSPELLKSSKTSSTSLLPERKFRGYIASVSITPRLPDAITTASKFSFPWLHQMKEAALTAYHRRKLRWPGAFLQSFNHSNCAIFQGTPAASSPSKSPTCRSYKPHATVVSSKSRVSLWRPNMRVMCVCVLCVSTANRFGAFLRLQSTSLAWASHDCQYYKDIAGFFTPLTVCPVLRTGCSLEEEEYSGHIPASKKM